MTSHDDNIRQQNINLAIRQLMGWPPYKPSNDCIAFACGVPLDPLLALKVAQMAEEMRKDWVYAQYLKPTAPMPAKMGIVYRGLASVDVLDDCHLWAADADAPLKVVSPRTDEHFAIDCRGSLQRIAGRPKNLAKGRALALRRVRKLAAGYDHVALPDSVFMSAAEPWVEPARQPRDTLVRFQ